MKFSAWLHALTEDTTPDGTNDEMVTYDASAATSKRVKLNNLAAALTAGIGLDGWTSADAMTYAAADAPTFTMTCTGDQSTKYYPGQRIKLTQATGGTKYFIITKVAYTSSTTLTIYGGTDYTLNNEAITSPFYSVVKAPAGFPLDPAKWTVKVTDTTDRIQNSPNAASWYNLGSNAITIPIGVWEVSYQVEAYDELTGAGWPSVKTTLSTGNNTESDKEFTAESNGTSDVAMAAFHFRTKTLVLTAKTAYYLNVSGGGLSGSHIDEFNSHSTLVLRAVCAYL